MPDQYKIMGVDHAKGPDETVFTFHVSNVELGLLTAAQRAADQLNKQS